MVGLGNPGKEYTRTRHNIGFAFVKKLAKDYEVKLKKRRYRSRTIVVETGDDRVLLALPQTYMNNSGQAVKQILKDGRFLSERIVVVYDDLDIPLGDIRVRSEGGAGTHKGIASIIEEIQTTRFPRIRIGIGPLEKGWDASDFVLSPFKEEENPIVENCLDRAKGALGFILANDIETAMNRYNQRQITEKESSTM
ncbi:aminoacyl-tRNA hydrolase [Acidobacteriota bacterium]